VIDPETIKLPVWVIGVGLVHAAAIALVLPMLITLPAPSGTEGKVEVVDVELVPRLGSSLRSVSMSIRRRHCLSLRSRRQQAQRRPRRSPLLRVPRPPKSLTRRPVRSTPKNLQSRRQGSLQ
jgi:hypothetical protein